MQLHSAYTNTTETDLVVLRIGLLGGFRVERARLSVSDFAWQRRSAKRLTKLLATYPRHALHREQIFDILWPDIDIDSARNSLAKALHAARHALEPDRRPRDHSSCLRMRDDMVVLDEDRVRIDADDFQRLAQDALRLGTAPAYEGALAAYTGVLLPEDLYEDWALERRRFLADLNVRLLLGLAETLEKRGHLRGAVEPLRTVLQEDPTREEVHRQLIRLYAAMGARSLALRQFEICRDVLRRELDVTPDHESIRLHEDLLATASERAGNTQAEPRPPGPRAGASPGGLAVDGAPPTPLLGREPALELLTTQLARAEAGNGGLIVISGEAGVGKTRLVARFLVEAHRRGARVLGDGRHTSSFPYGPFAAALEGFVSARADSDRTEMARRYPTLGCLVPSLETPTPSLVADGSDATRVRVGTEIARLLAEVAATQAVVLVIGDLDGAHSSSLELLQYLANLARQRRWLLIATLRDEAMVPGSGALRMLSSMTYEHLCLHVRLQGLERPECDDLVRSLLSDRVPAAEFLDRIYSLTHGNPLFVEEIARDVGSRDASRSGELHPEDVAPYGSSVPATVRAVVEKAIAPLGANVRRVLELAAVAGSPLFLDDLRHAAAELEPRFTDIDLFEALDRALSTRMLTEGADAYTIRHALVAHVLLQELPRHRHAQLTAALGPSARRHRSLLDGSHASRPSPAT